MTRRAQPGTLTHALERAVEFIAGFENDPSQAGVDELLRDLRAFLPKQAVPEPPSAAGKSGPIARAVLRTIRSDLRFPHSAAVVGYTWPVTALAPWRVVINYFDAVRRDQSVLSPRLAGRVRVPLGGLTFDCDADGRILVTVKSEPGDLRDLLPPARAITFAKPGADIGTINAALIRTRDRDIVVNIPGPTDEAQS